MRSKQQSDKMVCRKFQHIFVQVHEKTVQEILAAELGI